MGRLVRSKGGHHAPEPSHQTGSVQGPFSCCPDLRYEHCTDSDTPLDLASDTVLDFLSCCPQPTTPFQTFHLSR